MESCDLVPRVLLDCGVQLILFGHQHFLYHRLVTRLPTGDTAQAGAPVNLRSQHMRAFCCPTTLQYDAPANGFYVFDFPSESQVEWTMYGSYRVGSQLASPMKQLQQRSFDLYQPPTQEELDRRYEGRHTA